MEREREKKRKRGEREGKRDKKEKAGEREKILPATHLVTSPRYVRQFLAIPYNMHFGLRIQWYCNVVLRI